MSEYIVTLFDTHDRPFTYGFDRSDLSDNETSDYPALKALYRARDIYDSLPEYRARYPLSKPYIIKYEDTGE